MNRQAWQRIAPLIVAAALLAGCGVSAAPSGGSGGGMGGPTSPPASAGPTYPAVPPAGIPPVVGQGALAILPASTDGVPMPVTADLGSGWLATVLVRPDPLRSIVVRLGVTPAEVASPPPPTETALVLTVDLFDAETGARMTAVPAAPALGIRPPAAVAASTLAMWRLDPALRAYQPLATSIDEPRGALSGWLPNDSSSVVALSTRSSATGQHGAVGPIAVGVPASVPIDVPLPAARVTPADAPLPTQEMPLAPARGPLPARLAIAALGVDAPIAPVGLEASGIMGSPTEGHVVGWYELGPRPGELSNAVLAGHVDLHKRPGVFSRLRELTPGATIDVDTGLGIAYRYVVVDIRSYSATDAPTAEIFGPTSRPTLTLITCGGDFDAARREYLDRLVVRAVGA